VSGLEGKARNVSWVMNSPVGGETRKGSHGLSCDPLPFPAGAQRDRHPRPGDPRLPCRTIAWYNYPTAGLQQRGGPGDHLL